MWGLAPGGAPGGNIPAEVHAPLGPISAYASPPPPPSPGRPVDHCLFPLDRVRPGSLPGTLTGHCLILSVGRAGRAHGALGGERLWHPGGIWGAARTWEGWPWDLPAHARLPPLADEDVCVFKCSVSRETECSRVGKQSFIITLGCNSVLLQFATPSGTCPFCPAAHGVSRAGEPRLPAWLGGTWSLGESEPGHLTQRMTHPHQ